MQRYNTTSSNKPICCATVSQSRRRENLFRLTADGDNRMGC
jgi:hypothetical protein